MITHDITNQFRAATQHVAAGSLVKEDHFSLFEAVGALEIGDVKMDSGCLQPGEAMDQEFDMRQDLLPEELIWLMDELLNREVAWLMGYPLSQTLFTSVHIDRLLWPDPKTLDEADFLRGNDREQLTLWHAVLRVYCLLLIKTCDLVLSMITSQHYYEEEDFTTQLFNRELLHKYRGEDISSMAFGIMDKLQAVQIEDNLREAISARLSFRNEVLGVLISHSNGETTSVEHSKLMHSSLDLQHKTQTLGKIVPDAFSTKLQRRLASTVPPRPMVTVSMDQVWSFWHHMISDCRDVFAVREVAHSQDFFVAYQMFAYNAPQPSTYPRALLQMFLSHENLVGARVEPLQFLEEDLQTLTLPASPLLLSSGGEYGRLNYGNQRVADAMRNFVEKFEHNFTNLYRALCLNSCRIRRTFCHALLEWDNLQAQTEELDTTIQEVTREHATPYLPGSPPTFAFSLSSWVYHHKLNIHRLTIQMGFELSIYAPHEMAGMYWYLSHICDMHLSHLERISHFVTAKDTEVKRSKMVPATKERAVKECRDALDRLYRQYASVKATQLLAGTLHGIFIVLQRLEVFVNRQPLYSSDMMRYEIRMKPFLGLSIPEPLSYGDFEKEVKVENIESAEVLDQAASFAADAKKAWEDLSKTSWNMYPKMGIASDTFVLDRRWTADVKDCLKAAIAAALCIVKLKKVLHNDAWIEKALKEAQLPEIGKRARYHRWWIVPSLP